MGTRSVVVSTRKETEGPTTGASAKLEIDGVEIPGIESVVIDPINSDGIVVATVRLYVRLGN